MKEINNYENLRKLLKFESKDDYYFLQIIQRRKDNLGMKCDARGIKSYYIISLEMLDDLMDEIINLCKFFNARAYLNVNVRSWKTSVIKTVSNLVDRLGSDSLVRSNSIFDRVSSSCQKTNLGKDKLWVIDIDKIGITENELEDITNVINKVSPDLGNKVKCINPTKSGYHIITSPFNVSEFRKIHSDSDIEIKKSEVPTLLYMQVDNEKNFEYCKLIREYGGRTVPMNLCVKDIDKLMTVNSQ